MPLFIAILIAFFCALALAVRVTSPKLDVLTTVTFSIFCALALDVGITSRLGALATIGIVAAAVASSCLVGWTAARCGQSERPNQAR